jgi:lysophospholipase L1-like esterase
MKLSTIWQCLILAALCCGQAFAAEDNPDWANLGAYRSDNIRLAASAKDPNRIVFMGDSITEFWSKTVPKQYLNKPYVNRGISGQTAPQMLLRFRSDVIELQPKIVLILAGTNDIAGNTGPESNETIAGYIASMAELAQAHGIKVILCSVLPANRFYWIPEVKPAARIAGLNKWIKDYTSQNGFAYVDYYSPMVDEHLGLKREYSGDGVHPNAAGYEVMMNLAEQAINSVAQTK